MKQLRNILIGLACVALTFSSHVVNAQEEGTALSSECISHSPEQGPWICDQKTLNETKCESTPILGLDESWKAVRSKEDAFKLLKDKYQEFNDAKVFMSWLKCQNFRLVYAGEGIPVSSCDRCSNSIDIRAEYVRKEIEPYPLSFFSISRAMGWDEFQTIEIYRTL
jgi:hypothetical protein